MDQSHLNKEEMMTLKPEKRRPIPEDTAELGQKLLSEQNPYRLIGERLYDLIGDEDFADLFSPIGGPALSPALLALVTVFQHLEKRPDRLAAEDVRLRIDWKYALHLPLDHPGFHFTNLSHFRQRLLKHQAEYRWFDRLVQRLVELGLIRQHGRQRTDSTHVLGLVATLSRLELVWESLRLALLAIQEQDPAWLEHSLPEVFLQQYLLKRNDYNLSEIEIASQLERAGADGFWLLKQISQASPTLQALPAVQTLQAVWQQQFQPEDADDPPGPRTQLEAHDLIQSPHEPEVRYRKKRGKAWKGYSAQISETAEAKGEPNFLTDIGVNSAQTDDTTALPAIQARLAARQLSPREQVVDQNYLSGTGLAHSQKQGIRLIGPLIEQPGPPGFKLDDFQVDLQRQQATCPAGKQSVSMARSVRRDSVRYQFAFGPQCQACVLRSQCTQAAEGRTIQYDEYHPYVVQHRQFMHTAAFAQSMKSRPGIEGTISELVRQGLRQARYRGRKKVNLQAIFLGAAVNLRRLCRLWATGRKPSWASSA
jgi:transposase